MIRRLPDEPSPRTEVSEIRKAVSSLAETAAKSVEAVRSAFAAGVAPYQTVGSGSVSSYVTSFSTDDLGGKIVKSTSHLGLSTSMAGSSVPPPKPEIDSANVIEGPGGMLDQFSVKLVISIAASDLPKVSRVKIMRAKLGAIKAVRPTFSALINAPSLPGKSMDGIAAAAKQVNDIGVGNKLTTFISDNEFRGVSSPTARELRPIIPTLNTNKIGSPAALVSLGGADRSVVENLTFYLNRRSVGDIPEPELGPVDIGDRNGMNVLKGNSVASSHSGIVQAPNAMEFVEVACIDMGSPGTRSVGSFLESQYVDKSVVYGAGFVYYASSIGADGSEGPRSRLMRVEVVRIIPPEVPTVVYSLVAGHPRFSIRCAPGTDHIEVFRSGRAVGDSVRLGTEQSLISEGPSTRVGQFWHVSDLGLGADYSTTFVDSEAVSGDKLSYRIYSVDPYGMKCQTPFSCSIKMPEHGRPIPIPVPSLTVEQSTNQASVSLKMQVDDPRVAGFIVQRSDVTIHEKSVHQANQPEYNDIGISTPKRAGSRQGPTMRDADWPLYIPASAGSASYIDADVRIDRIYQYAVGAVDKRGNKTAIRLGNPVGVYSRTIVDAPVAFSSSIVVESDVPTGVLLSWSGGTNDFSPNDLVDDQDVLAATSVRSVFQVERRLVGAPYWDALPATSESWCLDPVSEASAPPFRPAYAIPGGEYEYRVLAMQSGGFVSQRTDSLPVVIAPPPKTPEIVWVRSTAIGVSPLFVIVSWNMTSLFVEKWEIERAVTNRLYGAQVPSMDSKMARNLEYTRVAEITPESSRARGLSTDSKDLDRTIYVGNRFYVDANVNSANSYFYRVRTVGRLGVCSDWSYAGVVLQDHAFERKFYSVLSDDLKVELTKEPREIILRNRR